MASRKRLPNIHPGEVLLGEFLLPVGISQNALIRATGFPPRRINEIVLGKRGIATDTALSPAKAFGTSEGFWLGLQADYDLEESCKQIGTDLDQIERLAARGLAGISTTAPLIFTMSLCQFIHGKIGASAGLYVSAILPISS